MSGYVLVHFRCVNCGRPAAGNPDKVPSVRVSFSADGQPYPDPNGTKEELCRYCAEGYNLQRKAVGLDPFYIPPDAYEAALEMP